MTEKQMKKKVRQMELKLTDVQQKMGKAFAEKRKLQARIDELVEENTTKSERLREELERMTMLGEVRARTWETAPSFELSSVLEL